MVDQELGDRNCIIPQGSHLEESSINRAKREEKDGRIISGIFHSNRTEQNLWHSPYWRCFKARAAVIHRVTLLLSPLNKNKNSEKTIQKTTSQNSAHQLYIHKSGSRIRSQEKLVQLSLWGKKMCTHEQQAHFLISSLMSAGRSSTSICIHKQHHRVKNEND